MMTRGEVHTRLAAQFLQLRTVIPDYDRQRIARQHFFIVARVPGDETTIQRNPPFVRKMAQRHAFGNPDRQYIKVRAMRIHQVGLDTRTPQVTLDVTEIR